MVLSDCGNYVEVDPGVTLGDLDGFLVPQGKVVPTGTVSQTGLAGLTLGGGIGWLTGIFGLTCDSLVGADVLLSDGRIVRAEDSQYQDLLWALKGGGGNFGIVLRFRFEIHDLPPTRCGAFKVSGADIKASLHALFEWLPSCPRVLTIAGVLTKALNCSPILSVDFCLASDDCSVVDELSRILPFAARSDLRKWDFVKWQRHSDDFFKFPMRGYWKSVYETDIRQDCADHLAQSINNAPDGCCSITIEHLHGRFSELTAADAAFALRDCKIGYLVSSRWQNYRDDKKYVSWVKDVVSGFGSPDKSLSYYNYSNVDVDLSSIVGISECRLRNIKYKYDPNNVFKVNHNII